jgi:hypothetical protein
VSVAKGHLADAVLEALGQEAIMAEHFPMLIHGGIPDVGLTVHSHFLTLLVTVGQSLGFSAIADCPIRWAAGVDKPCDVRADSIWFDPKSLGAVVAVEFERFERGDEPKLREKVENLAIASLGMPSLALAILVYWVRSGSSPRSMHDVVAAYREGFTRQGRRIPSAQTPLMIVKCVMREGAPGEDLVFGEFLRDLRNEALAMGGANRGDSCLPRPRR